MNEKMRKMLDNTDFTRGKSADYSMEVRPMCSTCSDVKKSGFNGENDAKAIVHDVVFLQKGA